eukprot:gene14802-17501_t
MSRYILLLVLAVLVADYSVRAQTTFQVSGNAFIDANEDGTAQNNEQNIIEGIVVIFRNTPYCITHTDPSGKWKLTKIGGTSKLDPGGAPYCINTNSLTSIKSGWVRKTTSVVYGYTWGDTNGDGLDKSEPYLGDIKVTLTKGGKAIGEVTTTAKEDGYRFIDLETGEHCLKFEDPSKKLVITSIGETNKVDPKTSTICFTIPPSEQKLIVAGFTDPKNVKLPIEGMEMEVIMEEPYLADIVATLQDQDGKTIKEFTTLAKFEGFKSDPLPAGKYCMVAKDPTGKYVITNIGSDSKFDPITSKYCFDHPLLNPVAIGMIEKYTCKITGYAWESKNGLLIVGKNPVIVAQVIITKPDDPEFKEIKFTTPNQDVVSTFADNLEPGRYCMKFTAEGLDAIDLSEDNVFPKENNTHCIDLKTDGKACSAYIKAGFKKEGAKYSISGHEFGDTNGKPNGIDSSEPYLSDIEFSLTKGEDVDIGKKVADAKRYGYTFDGLDAGDYCLRVKDTSANGRVVSPVKGIDHQFDALSSKYCFKIPFEGQTPTKPHIITAGMTPKYYSLTGHAFGDINGAPNGIDKSEPYEGDIQLILTKDDGNEVDKVVIEAKADGYLMENIFAGQYCLTAKDVSDPPKGRTISPVKGPDNQFDPESWSYYFVVPFSDQNDVGSKHRITVGVVPKKEEPKLYNVAISIFEDKNKNGENDKEPWFGTTRATITKEGSSDPPKTITIPASRTGYTFRGLSEGEYTIKFIDPKNRALPTIIGKDNVISPANSKYTFKLNDEMVNFGKETYKFQGGFALKKK